MNNDYWEPPQAATRSSLLSDFYREADSRILRNGKKFNNESIGQAKACIAIERFVIRVMACETLPYSLGGNSQYGMYFHETSLGIKMRELMPLLGFFDSHHDYSEHLYAFLHSCWLMESIYGLNLKQTSNRLFYPDIHFAEAMNDIVKKIRMCTKETWFQRMHSDRRYEANTKATNVAQITADTLQYYSRTMIVRMDLKYQKSERSRITINHVYEHLDQLLMLKNWHPVFQNLVGYAWAIEQGDRQGFHIHATFFFDGSKECRDIYKGIEISNLWYQITREAGSVYICNANKAEYIAKDNLGIGVIERNDSRSCLNAISKLPYMAKDTQYLRIKPKGRRTFGAGATPDMELKRGRPSLKATNWSY